MEADIGESTVQSVVSLVDQSPIQPPSTDLVTLRVEPASAQVVHVSEAVRLVVSPRVVKVIAVGRDEVSPVMPVILTSYSSQYLADRDLASLTAYEVVPRAYQR